jgi:hypothetical protein
MSICYQTFYTRTVKATSSWDSTSHSPSVMIRLLLMDDKCATVINRSLQKFQSNARHSFHRRFARMEFGPHGRLIAGRVAGATSL